MADRATGGGTPPARRGFGGEARLPRGRLPGCFLSGAILAAPFLALLYGPSAGLAAAAVGLAATAVLANDAAPGADPTIARRLRLAARFNAALALACLAVLAARLLG